MAGYHKLASDFLIKYFVAVPHYRKETDSQIANLHKEGEMKGTLRGMNPSG